MYPWLGVQARQPLYAAIQSSVRETDIYSFEYRPNIPQDIFDQTQWKIGTCSVVSTRASEFRELPCFHLHLQLNSFFRVVGLIWKEIGKLGDGPIPDISPPKLNWRKWSSVQYAPSFLRAERWTTTLDRANFLTILKIEIWCLTVITIINLLSQQSSI